MASPTCSHHGALYPGWFHSRTPGTVNWTAGTLSIRNNNSGNLGNAVNFGLWQMQGDLDPNQWFGNNLEIFNNSGTFRKSECNLHWFHHR